MTDELKPPPAVKIAIGCDPELFVFDTTLFRIVPAVGLVQGTKEKPFKLSKGTVQLDGTLIEIGTDPAYTEDDFVHNLKVTLEEVQQILDSKQEGRYKLLCGALAGYNRDDLKGIPKSVFNVGCEPQYHIQQNEGSCTPYSLRQMRGPEVISPEEVPAGGHIHIGFTSGRNCSDQGHLRDCLEVSRSIIGTLLNSPERQRAWLLFGGGRAIRVKPYGFEYRNPSAYWLHSEESVRLIFRQAVNAVHSAMDRTVGRMTLKGSTPAIWELPECFQENSPVFTDTSNTSDTLGDHDAT